jgi:hypothetical protein
MSGATTKPARPLECVVDWSAVDVPENGPPVGTIDIGPVPYARHRCSLPIPSVTTWLRPSNDQIADATLCVSCHRLVLGSDGDIKIATEPRGVMCVACARRSEYALAPPPMCWPSRT